MSKLRKEREEKTFIKLRGIIMKIIIDNKNELEIEITGESHTLCNALRKTLMEDDEVEAAAYTVEHPIIGEPKLYIKAKNPRKSLKKAAETLKLRSDEFKSLMESSRSESETSKSTKSKTSKTSKSSKSSSTKSKTSKTKK